MTSNQPPANPIVTQMKRRRVSDVVITSQDDGDQSYDLHVAKVRLVPKMEYSDSSETSASVRVCECEQSAQTLQRENERFALDLKLLYSETDAKISVLEGELDSTLKECKQLRSDIKDLEEEYSAERSLHEMAVQEGEEDRSTLQVTLEKTRQLLQEGHQSELELKRALETQTINEAEKDKEILCLKEELRMLNLDLQNTIDAHSSTQTILREKDEKYSAETTMLKSDVQKKFDQIHALQAELQDNHNQLRKAEDRYESINKALQLRGNEIATLQARLQQLEIENSSSRDQLTVSKGSRDKLMVDLEIAQTTLKEVELQKSELENLLERDLIKAKQDEEYSQQIKEQDRKLWMELTEARGSIESYEVECNKLKLELNEVKTALDSALVDHQQKSNQLEADLDLMESERHDLMQETGRLNLTIQQHLESLYQNATALKHVQANLDATQLQNGELTTKHAGMQQHTNDLQTHLDTVRKRELELKKELSQAQAELRQLSEDKLCAQIARGELNNAQGLLNSISDERDRLRVKTEEANETIVDLKNTISASEQKVQEEHGHLLQAQSKLEAERAGFLELERVLTQKYVVSSQTQEKMQQKLDEIAVQKEELQTRLTEAITAHSKCKDVIEQYQDDLERVNVEKEELHEQLIEERGYAKQCSNQALWDDLNKLKSLTKDFINLSTNTQTNTPTSEALRNNSVPSTIPNVNRPETQPQQFISSTDKGKKRETIPTFKEYNSNRKTSLMERLAWLPSSSPSRRNLYTNNHPPPSSNLYAVSSGAPESESPLVNRTTPSFIASPLRGIDTAHISTPGHIYQGIGPSTLSQTPTPEPHTFMGFPSSPSITGSDISMKSSLTTGSSALSFMSGSTQAAESSAIILPSIGTLLSGQSMHTPPFINATKHPEHFTEYSQQGSSSLPIPLFHTTETLNEDRVLSPGPPLIAQANQGSSSRTALPRDLSPKTTTWDTRSNSFHEIASPYTITSPSSSFYDDTVLIRPNAGSRNTHHSLQPQEPHFD